MPNSPKEPAVPPVAAPRRAGWCCLRCARRRGTSTSQPSVVVVAAPASARAEGVRRHAALAVELRPAHLRAAEAAGALHADAAGTGALRRLHALAHGAAEGHAAGELLGDALGDQLRLHLGVLDLEDVQLHLLAGELLQLAAQAVGLGAPATD